MSQQDLKFTLWDVGHGLCIWIQTPNGHNHWIDCGANGDFSPAEHVSTKHGVTEIDLLVISHPDSDHMKDLPNVVQHIGKPRTLLRNKSLSDEEKYKCGEFDYQKSFKELDTSYNQSVEWEKSACNPVHNGGVEVKFGYNNATDTMAGNNTSVVMLYFYAGWLFICPGDIEEAGWKALWAVKQAEFEALINKAKWRVLVAPHHGRESGYSQQMMDNLKPHVVMVSDVSGQSETDPRFRENPIGLDLTVAPDAKKNVKWLSTKRGGRIQFQISSDGKYDAHQYEYW